ncbi:zinc ribbon domain-containing protein [Fundidesulfovibrio agrisoli]|uniref:zinc ribbon domain-containing protein n=1 Tax=Fundidesulfovibrio agrisoli TaxID=2922717 RepID=UPI001FAE18D8|nr:C4-type zinc ribbon domain-containing protein [Fundidesulfovibrio agrisoli]
MYQKQIEQLVILQQIDGEMISLTAEVENAPKEIASLEKKCRDVEAQRDQVREKLGYLTDQLSRLETDIEDDHVRMKKSKSKMMMVGNSKEYNAMVREMDSLEKLNRSRDEEKAAFAEEVERQTTADRELSEQTEALRADLETAQAGLKTRLDAAGKRIAELSEQRTHACGVIPKPILSRYEFIRSRLANPVIVSVTNGVCSGCNISIPPQAFIELQKGQQILSCPNCQRLIYWDQHILTQEKAEEAQEA